MKKTYLLKASGDNIAVNRTIAIKDEVSPFVVLVTDRDYADDLTGESQTLIFTGSYYSLEDASNEAKWQFDLSIADGFLENNVQHPPY
jgi:hypothetical protein